MMRLLLPLALLGHVVAMSRPATFLTSAVSPAAGWICKDGVCIKSKVDAASASASWEEESAEMIRTGECKWFDEKKGYGFISMTTRENKVLDVFVHHSDVHWHDFYNLPAGEPLEFRLARNRDSGKFKAIRVTGPEGAPVRGLSAHRATHDVAADEDWTQAFDDIFGI